MRVWREKVYALVCEVYLPMTLKPCRHEMGPLNLEKGRLTLFPSSATTTPPPPPVGKSSLASRLSLTQPPATLRVESVPVEELTVFAVVDVKEKGEDAGNSEGDSNGDCDGNCNSECNGNYNCHGNGNGNGIDMVKVMVIVMAMIMVMI